MIQAIGLIIAIYAIARLLQIPIQQEKNTSSTVILVLISFIAAGLICVIGYEGLIEQGTRLNEILGKFGQ